MKMEDCKGFMVPGLYFENDFCFFLINWYQNPSEYQKLKEIWVFYPRGKRVCYIDPGEAVPFFNTYHTFDEVIPARIEVNEQAKGMVIEVTNNSQEVIKIQLRFGFSPLALLFNLLIKNGKGIKGKTETGKTYHNIPEHIKKIKSAHVNYKGVNSGNLTSVKRDITIGDGRISKIPIISFCTQKLEI